MALLPHPRHPDLTKPSSKPWSLSLKIISSGVSKPNRKVSAAAGYGAHFLQMHREGRESRTWRILPELVGCQGIHVRLKAYDLRLFPGPMIYDLGCCLIGAEIRAQ